MLIVEDSQVQNFFVNHTKVNVNSENRRMDYIKFSKKIPNLKEEFLVIISEDAILYRGVERTAKFF